MPSRSKSSDSLQAKIAALDANQREIVEALRKLVKKADPRATEALKWNMPVFEDAGMLCYIWPLKGAVNFGFYNASPELDDPKGLLVGTGKKMRHVKLRRASDVNAALFTKWVKRAAEFNRSGMRASGAAKKGSSTARSKSSSAKRPSAAKPKSVSSKR